MLLKLKVLLVRCCKVVGFLKVMKEDDRFPGLKFFNNAFKFLLSEMMMYIVSGLLPNLIMYNTMNELLCNNGDIDHTFFLLD